MSIRHTRTAPARKSRLRRPLSTETLESRHLLATIYAGFGDLPLAADSYWNGPDVAGTESDDPFGGELKIKNGVFQSRAINFANSYNPNTYGNPAFKPSWSGFAYSNLHDRTTPGFDNQFSSYHVGATSGFDDANFALAFGSGAVGTFNPADAEQLADLPTFTLPENATIIDARVTNMTYAALSMRDGDDFTEKFGGASGSDPDFLKLTAYGTDAAGNALPGFAEIFLADYTSSDNAEDYLLDTWERLDLSALTGARKIHFNLTSSDNGPFGMNTPATFAIDAIRYTLPEANAAPVLDTAPDTFLDEIDEDTRNPRGTLVFDLIDGVVSDSNANAKQGIAIVNVTGTAFGRWEFTRNDGATWQLMNQPTANSALLLGNDPHTRVRFVPIANATGEAWLTFRAWDQTQGTPGGRLSTSGRIGGTGTFSTASDLAIIHINPINDAPTIPANPKPTLGVVPSDTPETSIAGVEVISLLSGMGDVDPGSTVGIAVVDLTEKSHGAWQYSSDEGTTWLTFVSASEGSATLLTYTDKVRFVPNPGYYGTPQLKYRAWDMSDGMTPGSIGTTVGQTGGSGAYSVVAKSAKLTVEANPKLTLSGTIGYVRNSGQVLLTPNATVTDPDSPDFALGQLYIRITTGGENANRLQIGSQFTVQHMTLGQAEIKYGATVIGTTTAPGGVSSTNLLIRFNANATASIVQTLIRSITFGTVDGASAGTRTILYSLTDGDGGTAIDRVKYVNVT